jgi:hypothetical protein
MNSHFTQLDWAVLLASDNLTYPRILLDFFRIGKEITVRFSGER